MSGIWLQGFVIGLIVYGIVIFLFGVRNLNDFIQFTSRFNRKKNRLLAYIYLILPPVLFGFFAEIFVNNRAFFFDPITLSVFGVLVLLAVLIPLLRKIDWKNALKASTVKIRNVVTPLQIFIWSFLLLLSIVMTWILIGEFWIFTNIVIWILIIIYLQGALLYWFGSYFKRKYIERLAKKGQQYSGSTQFKITKTHLYIFLLMNVATLVMAWIFIGEFWIFSDFVVWIIIILFTIISIFWAFGTFIWNRYLSKLAETNVGFNKLVKWIKHNSTDAIFGGLFFLLLIIYYIFREPISAMMTNERKLALLFIGGGLLVLYLVMKFVFKRFSFNKIYAYFGFRLDKSITQHLSDEGKKEHTFQLIKVYLLFTVKLIILVIILRLLFQNNELVLKIISLEDMKYPNAVNFSFILFTGWWLLSGLDAELTKTNYNVSLRKHYIRRKRKLLMIELEELQKQVEEEKDLLAKLEEKNIQAAIEVLRKNGYQIVIGPDTKSQDAAK